MKFIINNNNNNIIIIIIIIIVALSLSAPISVWGEEMRPNPLTA